MKSIFGSLKEIKKDSDIHSSFGDKLKNGIKNRWNKLGKVLQKIIVVITGVIIVFFVLGFSEVDQNTRVLATAGSFVGIIMMVNWVIKD